MKTKLLLTLFLIIPIVGFILIKSNSETYVKLPPPPTTGNIADSFLIGCMWDGLDYDMHWLDSLGFNVWHWYSWSDGGNRPGWRHYPIGWWGAASGDSLLAPENDPHYIPDIQTKLNSIYTHNNNCHMRTLMDRPKIEWLCYGQRSDYQCETISSGDLWFYSFQSPGHVGTDMQDNSNYGTNQWVRHCYPDPQSSPGGPGFVDSLLKANTEQCNASTFLPWTSDSECTWIIKPRIRIDSAYANNHAHDTTRVCRINITNDDNHQIKSIDIRVRNFRPHPDSVYHGNYLDSFYFVALNNAWTDTSRQSRPGSWGDWYPWRARGNATSGSISGTDISIYYYSYCDAWFDYVRVDNDIADELFRHQHDDWIQWEAEELGCYTDSPLKFYIESFEFNNIPCMTYVSKKLDSLTNLTCGKHVNLMAGAYWSFSDHMNINDRGTVMTADYIIDNYIDKLGAKEVFGGMGGCYPFRCRFPDGCALPWDTCTWKHSKIPNTVSHSNSHILADAISPATYDAWLQMQLDTFCYYYKGTGGWNDISCSGGLFDGGYTFTMKLFNEISRRKDIPFIAWGQAHQHVTSGGDLQREPTNEELDLTANIPISYGAKGILYYGFNSWQGDTGNCNYGYGMFKESPVMGRQPDPNTSYTWTPRDTNLYGQLKWRKFKDEIFPRLRKWQSYIMSFDNTQSFSYLYRDPYERSDLRTNSYIKNVYTFRPGSGDPECPEYGPSEEPPESQSGLTYECPSHTYMQVATFQTETESIDKYFMLVNKRCSPYLWGNSQDSNGGRRDVRIKFYANHSAFNGYNNWAIYDLETGSKVLTFDKTQSTLLDLDWYMPGQGKLYRISPVMRRGGTLVTDESVSGLLFTCLDTVWNNGYDITIGNNTTISFTDTSKIIMDGGTFQSGIANDTGSSSITFRALSGNHWYGLDFDNCAVKVYNSLFQNLVNDTTYALNIVNCPHIDIRDNTFNFESDNLKGGINISYFESTTPLEIDTLYIENNTFNSNYSTVPALSIMSYAGMTTPAIINYNTFSSNTSGSTAIFLSEVTGGAVKNNTISHQTAINMLSSSVDVYHNSITCARSNSIGINGLSGSVIKMNMSQSYLIGGLNYISSTGAGSKNILVDDSYFLLDMGFNSFNTINSTGYYHLYGYFPQEDISTQETKNCFTFDGQETTTPADHVTYGYNGSQIVFNFASDCSEGHGCEPSASGLDTLFQYCSGGGGLSSRIIITPKSIHDSLCLELRMRNYSSAKTKAEELLNLFPDSLLSLDAVSKLYLASIKSDTSSESITALKTFYRNLILNDSLNSPLVKRCNYFIQKCKVLLHQYSSAMSGFEQIMQQNPYSYEALVAHWDYMATQLLMNGSGGGYGSDIDDEYYDDDENNNFDNDGDDKNPRKQGKRSPFTKEQRKRIGETIIGAYEQGNTFEEKKIEELKELSEKGNVDASNELAVMNALKEAVKPLHPRNVREHLNIVNNDIQKLFAVNKGVGNNEVENAVPKEFKLHQNFPNPFNPITKIKYELPNDVKITIRIYDILGREVKTLVNDFKKAGYYEEIFDGANLASGVYFYRLEAGEFVQSKKMVLVK